METRRGSLLISESARPEARSVGSSVEERSTVSALQRLAVFLMTFGPGSAIATYTTLFGWFQQTFHSSEVLLFMRIALFAPFPVMKIFQSRYDSYFDEVWSTKTAYLFRVVIMQLVIACLMVVWMFIDVVERAHVICFGLILGTCCAPFIGSSVQIAVAIDPVLVIWAQLGNTVGQAVPVIFIAALGFSPTSSHAELCKVIAVPMIVCILTAISLGTMYYAEVFSGAFAAINQRRASQQLTGLSPEEEVQEHGAATSADSAAAAAAAEASGLSTAGSTAVDQPETSGSASTDQREDLPRWIWIWLGLQSFGISCDFFLLALIGYMGSPETTHHLAAGTLLSAVAGRLLSLPFRYLPGFDKGPMHITGACLFGTRWILWAVCMLRLGKVWEPSLHTLIAVWCSWNTVCMLHNSLTDITVTTNVKESQKQVVAQYGLITTYSGLFIGLLVATVLALTVEEDSLGGSSKQGSAVEVPSSLSLWGHWDFSKLPWERWFLGCLGNLAFFLTGYALAKWEDWLPKSPAGDRQ